MKRTVRTFDPVIVLLLDLLVELALPLQPEDSVLDPDAYGIPVHAGQLRPDADGVLRFIDIHRGHPDARPRPVLDASCFRTCSSSDFIDSFASVTAASTSAARSAGTFSRFSRSVFSVL